MDAGVTDMPSDDTINNPIEDMIGNTDTGTDTNPNDIMETNTEPNSNSDAEGNTDTNADETPGSPGDNADANPVDEVAPGPSACCLPNGTCTVTTREECNGAFIGAGLPCSATSCEVSPFTDEAAERGITYTALFPRGEPDVVPGSGIGFLDLDGDDDPDMMVLGRVGDGLVGVFENDGRGHFTDRSAESGIAPSRLMRGIAAADYDADGDLDVYLSFWTAPNVLMRNDGGFRFTDVTEAAGVGQEGKGAGSAWGDYDGDGWLDLYATDYGIDAPNRLYRNRGNGSFEEVAESLGVASGRRSMQAAFLDYDGDADMDLYVANDLMGFECPTCCNELYRNDGGAFTLVSDDTGANACLNSMCIAVGDVDNNLKLDMFFTDDSLPPGNMLILNQGDGTFIDASTEAAVNPRGIIGWGATFFDYDHNGYEDLFVTYNTGANQFYQNDGRFPFAEVAYALRLNEVGGSYCTATADVDADGDLDLAVWIRQHNIKLYMNNEGHKRRWVKFNVVGEGRNTRGVGAMVTIAAGGRRQIRHLMAGNNFKGHDSSELHFGLDTARMVDEIVIVWPGGIMRTLHNYAADQTWRLYPPRRLGDANGDGIVDADDRAVLENCRGPVRSGCEMMDIDGDGDVDDADQAAQ